MAKYDGKYQMFVIFCCFYVVKHFNVSHCIRHKAATLGTSPSPVDGPKIEPQSQNQQIRARTLQQGWYLHDQRRPNPQQMQNTRYRNFHFIYTLRAYKLMPEYIAFILI